MEAPAMRIPKLRQEPDGTAERYLADHLDWIEKSLAILDREDARAAERVRGNIRSRIAVAGRDVTPMETVQDVTHMILRELETVAGRLRG
jgi:hypothetical protein